jgi:hypothetical protein
MITSQDDMNVENNDRKTHKPECLSWNRIPSDFIIGDALGNGDSFLTLWLRE